MFSKKKKIVYSPFTMQTTTNHLSRCIFLKIIVVEVIKNIHCTNIFVKPDLAEMNNRDKIEFEQLNHIDAHIDAQSTIYNN